MAPSFDLTGRVAVVTGAAGLLGVKHCEALAAAGAHVVGLELEQAPAAALAQRLSADYGVKCLGLGADIRQRADVQQAMMDVMETFGRVDILVNNARWLYRREELLPFEEFDVEVLRHDFSVQVEGALMCSQILGAQMVRQGRGSIVNIGSIYGLVAPDMRLYQDEAVKIGTPVSYAIAKSALLGLTQYLAAYWAPKGVRVNLLTPGGIRLEGRQSETFLKAYNARVPLGRMAEPDEMQGALVFLSSDASSYMTGSNLVVDGGWTAW